MAMPRALRSSIDSLSASGMRRCAARKPSAALSPASLRMRSANTGPYSTQWPSASRMGCLRLARTSEGLRWELMPASMSRITKEATVILPAEARNQPRSGAVDAFSCPCRQFRSKRCGSPNPAYPAPKDDGSAQPSAHLKGRHGALPNQPRRRSARSWTWRFGFRR